MASGRFTPIPPSRLLDTAERTSQTQGRPIQRGVDTDVKVLGRGGVPSRGVSAVSLNVTVVSKGDPGYLSVWPTGQPVPTTSNINFGAHDTVAAASTVTVGSGGNIRFRSPVAGNLRVVIDVTGWWSTSSTGGSGYVPLATPVRLRDTRADLNGRRPGRLRGPGTLDIACRGRHGVSNTATGVLINVTGVKPTGLIFLSAYPQGDPNGPKSSTLNVDAGQVRANMAAVELSGGGAVSIRLNQRECDVVVDLVGYFDPKAKGTYTPIASYRAYDSRAGRSHAHTSHTGKPTGSGLSEPLSTREVLDLPLRSVPGVAANAKAVLCNVTVTGGTHSNFISTYPAGQARPNVSTVNVPARGTICNNTYLTLDEHGWASFYSHYGDQHLIVDVVGYFS